MILLLDVGNSQIFGGLVDEKSGKDEIVLRFRKSSTSGFSSDEAGMFLRQVIRENGYDPESVTKVGICTVVPDLTYSLRNACVKYFGCQPFLLQAGVKTGLRIRYRNPVEVGADRIANSIAATQRFPHRDLVIVDLGTATTFCAVTREKDYLGGTILAGMRISMEALESRTAKLPTVEIVRCGEVTGRSTVESIQTGLYFGHLGAMKEIIGRISKEMFRGERPFVIGTGGFARLFEGEGVFDAEVPDLVLLGLYDALKMNSDEVE